MNKINKLLYLSFINNFSISILWTGLPVLLYMMTESLMASSALFVTASISRVIASFFSGYFIDRYSNKYIMALCITIMIFSSVLIYTFLLQELFVPLFTAMIIYQFFGSITATSKNIWYRGMIDDSKMVQSISRMSTYDMSSKTIGFTVGPLIFSLIGGHTVLINILLLIISLIFVGSIKKDNIEVTEKSSILKQYKSAFEFLINNRRVYLYALVSIMIGIIGPTLLSLATFIIAERYDLIEGISLFWLVSGISVVLSNIVLSRVNKTFIGSRLYFVILFLFYCVGIMTLTVAGNYIIFIVGFAMFTLGGPFVMNVVQSNIFINTDNKIKGKVIGIIQSSSDLGTLVTVVMSWWIVEYSNINYFLYYLSVMAIAMYILFFYTVNNVERESVKSTRNTPLIKKYRH